MKKIIVRLLTLVVLLGVMVGCGQQNTGDDTVTLNVWGDPDNRALVENAFTRINEAFEVEHENIKINYQYSGSYDALNIAVQSDTLPDLFWVQGNKTNKMEEMARNGFLLAIDDYNIDSSRFPEVSIDYAMVDGKTYSSYPSFFDYALIYYNKDIFSENNLSVPDTFDDFINIMETLNNNDVTPVAFGGAGLFDRYWAIGIMAPSLFNDVMIELKEGTDVNSIDFTDMAEAFDYYAEFAAQGYFGKDFSAIDGAGAQLSFLNGSAAMIFDGTWSNQIYESSGLNVGRFALPGFDGNKYSQEGPSNMLTYAISSKTEYPDEAVLYLDFLNSKVAQQIYFEEVKGIPLVSDIEIDDPAVQEMADFDIVGLNLYDILSKRSNENAMPQDVFVGELLPKIMLSEITGEEAVELLIAEMNK